METLVQEEQFETHEEADSDGITCGKVFILVTDYVPCVTFTGYALTKLIYASVHLYDCPHAPMVPFSVLISGCIQFVVGCVAIGVRHRGKVMVEVESKGEKKTVNRCSTLALFLVMLLWVIIESPFVFIEYNQTMTTGPTSECSASILKFAFVTIILDWIFITIGLLSFLLCWCTSEVLRKLF